MVLNLIEEMNIFLAQNFGFSLVNQRCTSSSASNLGMRKASVSKGIPVEEDGNPRGELWEVNLCQSEKKREKWTQSRQSYAKLNCKNISALCLSSICSLSLETSTSSNLARIRSWDPTSYLRLLSDFGGLVSCSIINWANSCRQQISLSVDLYYLYYEANDLINAAVLVE